MRIGFNLLYLKGNLNGGTSVYGLCLLKAVAAQNAKDTFFAFIRKGERGLEKAPGNIEKCMISFPGGSVVTRVLLEQTLLPILAARNKIDIMFSPAFVSPIWGPFRKITAIHDLYFKVCPEVTKPWQRRYWSVFVPLSLLSSDAILASSNNTRMDLERFYPWFKGKNHVIHCAPNTELTSIGVDRAKGDKDPERYLVFLSNITPNKNVGMLVEAIRDLNAQGFSIGLKVVGNDLHGLLGEAVSEFSAKGYVEHLGYLAEDRLASVMRGALCLVVPSTYEGFGMTVLEGMAMGTPVIASLASSLPEVGGSAAIYFDPKSKNDLCDRICELLADSDGSLRLQLREKGYENLKRFSWQKSAKKLYGLFQSINGR